MPFEAEAVFDFDALDDFALEAVVDFFALPEDLLAVAFDLPDDDLAAEAFDVDLAPVLFFFAEPDFDAVALLELFLAELDLAELFFEALDVVFFAVLFLERLDVLLRAEDLLRDDLPRVTSARFQPIASSARKAAGIARTPVGPSRTASTAASARSARTSEITLAGRLARAACTRFVRRITNISRSGSIQMDVPV